MKKLNVKEYNLDCIMENYFNTDKEVMFLCDYKTAWEILKFSEYNKYDFENYFSVELDCEYPYYSIYKNSNDTFIIEFLTKLDGTLYPSYDADNLLIQDSVLDEYGDNILEKCYANDALSLIGDYEFVDLENLKSLEENYVDDLSDKQCNCCKCCDECCEEEKDEVLDQIYHQGVIDAFKAIDQLIKHRYIK
ncbi:hypothetical protein [Clostridium botulinum]|uniref:hypothetical protein n=1 Tax=Clostridium botulinum TaxID=1491 RepID=UPI0004D579DB|nr:hypothetical protein [Clostridium botulinum]KEH99860.1 hypothetical protein Z952_p0192 [Clostridium botulinum C/D str. BKT75002]KEI05339.1 hypothetical protein Z954_0193 [Clostridium botulinum C/D str. BKT2873]QPW62026.1 hypothetical protein IG390_14330 [Clostridium botulinum]